MYQKLLISLLFSIGWYSIAIAQQLPIFTQYREYHSFINPASVNSDYLWNEYPLSFGISSRTQWSGQSYTPRTLFARGEYVYSGGGTFGLVSGVYIIKDDFDPFSSTGIYGRLGVLTLGDRGEHYLRSFSIGFTGGVTQFRLNTTGLNARDLGDESIVNAKSVDSDLGVGIFFQQKVSRYQDDAIYIGASIPQILSTEIQLTDGQNQFSFQKVPHYYGLVGYYKSLGDYTFLEPSIWLSYVHGTQLLVDVNLRYQFSEYFWLGTGYGSQGVLHVEAGIWIGSVEDAFRVKVGYGYDNYFTSFGPRLGAAHEINVGIVISE